MTPEEAWNEMRATLRRPARLEAMFRWIDLESDEQAAFATWLATIRQQARAEALEEAAKVCQMLANEWGHEPLGSVAAMECARHIRALKERR